MAAPVGWYGMDTVVRTQALLVPHLKGYDGKHLLLSHEIPSHGGLGL